MWCNTSTILAHSHSGYATTSHSHSDYAGTSHSHSGYASSSHSHSGYITSLAHSHSGYISTSGGTVSGCLTIAGSYWQNLIIKSPDTSKDPCINFMLGSTDLGGIKMHSSGVLQVYTSGVNNVKTVCTTDHSHSEYAGGGSPTISSVGSSKAYLIGSTSTSGSLSTAYYHSSIYMQSGYIYTSSDLNLKENLKSIDNELVNKIYSSNDLIYDFTWKDSQLETTGFIAQYLEEIDPNLVNTDEDGIKAVNYNAALSKMVGVLFKKTKEQDKIIKEHNDKINEQEKRINELENVIRKLLSIN